MSTDAPKANLHSEVSNRLLLKSKLLQKVASACYFLACLAILPTDC